MDEDAATTSSRPALAGVSSATEVDDSVPRRLATVDSTTASQLLAVRDLRLQHDAVAGELLNDGEKAGVEEADLEEHQERQRAVDAVGQRVEDRGGEVEPEAQLDERLDGDRLPIPLASPTRRRRLRCGTSASARTRVFLSNSASSTAFVLFTHRPMPIEIRNGM